MKISLNTVRNLTAKYAASADPTAIGKDKLLQKIGAQLGGIDEVTDLGQKYQGIVIVRVISCEQHPNADRLQVCAIDDGGAIAEVARDEAGHVQVVCGAPNVAAGQYVAWLPPGSTVPETVGREPFVLSAREIRGVVSNGMLASPKELSLGDSHEGLLLLAGEYQAGADFAETFGLKDDTIIDIENKMFTHRPDCFGWLGVAREMAGIQNQQFRSPAWYTADVNAPESSDASKLPLNIQNDIADLVPRFTAVVIEDVTVQSSPAWLQIELAKVGVRPISNIVDLTNYYMLLTGQPLHAYDYDKVKQLSNGTATIVIRKPQTGEKIKLLNGKEIEPRADGIMIATDKQLIGLGGVMGGSQTEVDSGTRNIIIESASFDMYSIRRTSMAHGLFTDAVTRFNKGQSPLQTKAVAMEMAKAVLELAGGEMAGEIIDNNHLPPAITERGSLHQPVAITTAFINARLGLQLAPEDIANLLKNVEFDVLQDGNLLAVAAPFWRTDISLREDVVEEVGRLYGYDHLPLELPKRDAAPTIKDAMFETKAAIRSRLSRAGANEILTYSFVHGDLLQKANQDISKAFEVSNALSPDLQYYRLSLMPSLLEKVHPNLKAGYDEFVLFEIGKGHAADHFDDEGLPAEFEFTGLVVAANDKLKRREAAYYQAKHYLEYLTGDAVLEYREMSDDMQEYAVARPYDVNRSAAVMLNDDTLLGIVGEFKPEVRRKLKLPRYSAGFEIDTAAITRLLQRGPDYRPLTRFPSVKQDVSLRVAADLQYEELRGALNGYLAEHAPENSNYKLEPVDIFQAEDNRQQKNITMRLTIASHQRTLTDTEVNSLLDGAAEAARQACQAERL